MKLNFDYYHNLEQVELYLCNPDGRELFPLPGKNRNVSLRFNDLSELTFEVDSKTTLSDGTTVELEAYDYIETKRLIYATNIGWFQITGVDENDNGVVKYKSVTTESYQSVLKNKGFLSEERVYCFYNPNDPYDDRYDSTQEDSIPSVIGQWSKQLGIKLALGQGLTEPDEAFDDWTITYIHPSLTYTGEGSVCRTFKENTTYGYDWMVNDVEEAFEVLVLFDFMYKTIHIMTPDQVATKVNVIYTFNNFMKNVNINEAAENIVTVLNCNGDNCDITAVNPTGTNYICDFSYYMDKTNYRWMSAALIAKIEAWKADCAAEKDTYTDYVTQLRSLYQQKTECQTELQEMSLVLTDLRTAQNKRTVVGSGTPGALCGIVCAESVDSGKSSIRNKLFQYGEATVNVTTNTYGYGTATYTLPQSNTSLIRAKFISSSPGTSNTLVYKSSATQVSVAVQMPKNGAKTYAVKIGYYFQASTNLSAFSGNTVVTAYQFSPDYDAESKKWVFSGSSKTGTADSIVASNLSDDNTSGVSYWYFSDGDDGASYCKLQSAVTVNKDTATSSYYCGGFDRYIAYTYPVVNETTGATTYTDSVQAWINLRESIVTTLENTDTQLQSNIDIVAKELDDISSRLNILSYFASTPSLLRELNCYWIEGDYTNDNIAVLDETTLAEEIDLSNELLDAGYIELSKVCQPRLSFSLESIDATKNYEFREQMRLLELGKIITIEKEEGLWYYPALLEISMNLDNSEEFSMTFANAMRLDDWGYTYADLMADASSTSRQVSANWQDILAYAKERKEITSLIKDPLDMTLRAASANMVNQDFVIDKTGILGRKKVTQDSDEFEDEQVRLINNLLIFTDDNWETAKTALGKVYYEDDEGNTISTYGLIAETIIGSLIMGERLKIKNTDSTIELGAEGITIKQADGTVVFSAKPDGSLVVRNYASQTSVDTLSGDLDSLSGTVDGIGSRLTTAEFTITQHATSINAKVSQTYGLNTSSFGWSLKSNGFYIYANASSDPVMKVTSSGLEISGKIIATSGSIGGVAVTTYSGNMSGYTKHTGTKNVKITIPQGTYGYMDVSTWAIFAAYQNYTKADFNIPDDAIFGECVIDTADTDYQGSGISGFTGESISISVWVKQKSTNGVLAVARTVSVSLSYSYYTKTTSKVTYASLATIDNNFTIDTTTTNGQSVVTSDAIYACKNYTTLLYAGRSVIGDLTFDNSVISSSCGAALAFDTLGDSATASITVCGNLICVYLSSVVEHNTHFQVVYYANSNTSKRYFADIVVSSGTNFGKVELPSYFTVDKARFFYNNAEYTTRNIDVNGVNRIIIRNSYLIPQYDNQGLLGTDQNRWYCLYSDKVGTSSKPITTMYATTLYVNGSAITTSDADKKYDIAPLCDDIRFDKMFYDLIPVSYKLNNGTSGRTHYGFTAQGLKAIMDKLEIDAKDFAGYCAWEEETATGEKNITYGIRYEEFIALCIDQVQKLNRRLIEAENKIKALENGGGS